MKTNLYRLLLIPFILGLSACVDQAAEVDKQQYLVRSKTIATELKATLGAQLKVAMESGGPVAALQVCKHVAQPLTQSLSEQHPDAIVSRTALKVRNPQNRADAESTEVLERWVADIAEAKQPEGFVIENTDNVVVHLPILTEQVCLKCHGNPDTFAPELKQVIADLYPSDEATDFVVGDLRGAIRIEFPQP